MSLGLLTVIYIVGSYIVYGLLWWLLSLSFEISDEDLSLLMFLVWLSPASVWLMLLYFLWAYGELIFKWLRELRYDIRFYVSDFIRKCRSLR